MQVNDSSFWWYKTCANIRGGSPGGTSNDSGVVDNGNFQHFRWLFFGYFRDEASVIIWRYAVRRRLFSDPKMHDLE